jgi:DNA-repair protein XRCC2
MLQSHLPHMSKADLDAQVKDGLRHVHVFRPHSSAQLLATLESLPDYLLSREQHHSQQRPLGLVILDSATAFYWADRADAELARLSDPGATAPPSTAYQTTSQLKELEQNFSCMIIFTTDASLRRKNRSRPDSAARTIADSPLPPQNENVFQDPWTNFATVTLDLHRVSVPQYAPAMTIEECARDQPRRFEAVQWGRHRAQVIWAGTERDDIREDARKLKGNEGFGFRVTGQGVEIELPSSL